MSGEATDRISIEALSRWTGEPEERLREWRSLGLIGDSEKPGFAPLDMQRVRVVQRCLRQGIELESITEALGQRREMFRLYIDNQFLDALLRPSVEGPLYSLAEAAERAGLEMEIVRRYWEAAGLMEQGDGASEEDVRMLGVLKASIEAGFPQEALLQLVRVYSDAMSRIAEAESRLTHFYVHDRMKWEGRPDTEVTERLKETARRLNPGAEPAILYFHRKGLLKAALEDAVMHLEEEIGLTLKTGVPGQVQRAIAFVDLSSFTPLTEAMGDEKAAEVVDRFSALVRESTGRWDGRVVKRIGDAFMLAFSDARSAVACALEIEARTADEPQFPAARSGLHWGKVLYREGDYVGSNVNIASRVAGEAERHQVLVTEATRRAAKELDGVEFVRLGKRRVKGLPSELALFKATPTDGEAREKAIDPVCGMEMGPAEVAARLSIEGEEKSFCSDECLRKYVQAPATYDG